MGVVVRHAWSESQLSVLMGYLSMSTTIRCYESHHRWHFCFCKTVHWCIVRARNTAQLLQRSLLPFCWTTPPYSLELNALINLQDLGSHTAEWVWVVSRKDWLNSGNALYTACKWKAWISGFPILPGSAEAQVIWGVVVKRLLIAYFIHNISADKY